MVEQFAIEDIILFHLDFDPEIVAQFFASVHFHTDVERSMTWMTNGERMTADWKEFMDPLVCVRTPTHSLHPRRSFCHTLLRRHYPLVRIFLC